MCSSKLRAMGFPVVKCFPAAADYISSKIFIGFFQLKADQGFPVILYFYQEAD